MSAELRPTSNLRSQTKRVSRSVTSSARSASRRERIASSRRRAMRASIRRSAATSRVSAAPLDDCYPGQDDLPASAFCREAAHEILAGVRILRLGREPGCHLARPVAREHPVSVGRAERLEMLLSRLATGGVGEHGVVADPKLGADGPQHGFGNDLAV